LLDEVAKCGDRREEFGCQSETLLKVLGVVVTKPDVAFCVLPGQSLER
jgi:hypothetical protein